MATDFGPLPPRRSVRPLPRCGAPAISARRTHRPSPVATGRSVNAANPGAASPSRRSSIRARHSASQARLVTLGQARNAAASIRDRVRAGGPHCRIGHRRRPAGAPGLRAPDTRFARGADRRSGRVQGVTTEAMAHSRSIECRPAATLSRPRQLGRLDGAPLRRGHEPLWASAEIVVDGQDIPDLVLSPVPASRCRAGSVFAGDTAAAEIVGGSAAWACRLTCAHGAGNPMAWWPRRRCDSASTACRREPTGQTSRRAFAARLAPGG